MDHPKRKIKGNIGFNHTVEQRDLTDILRTFHPRVVEYTFFSSAHGTFYSIDHMTGHKINVMILRLKIIPKSLTTMV